MTGKEFSKAAMPGLSWSFGCGCRTHRCVTGQDVPSVKVTGSKLGM